MPVSFSNSGPVTVLVEQGLQARLRRDGDRRAGELLGGRDRLVGRVLLREAPARGGRDGQTAAASHRFEAHPFLPLLASKAAPRFAGNGRASVVRQLCQSRLD